MTTQSKQQASQAATHDGDIPVSYGNSNKSRETMSRHLDVDSFTGFRHTGCPRSNRYSKSNDSFLCRTTEEQSSNDNQNHR